MNPQYKAVITSISVLSPTVIDLTITRLDGLEFPDFLAGQYMTLSFPTHSRIRGARSFSIVSSPTDLSSLRFGIRIHGSYTRALLDLRAGDPVLATGPFGQFTFDPARDRSAVFIAGGIGVTPFYSMIKTATDLKLDNDLTLLYSVRSMDDAPLMDEFNSLQQSNPHLRAVYAVTDGNIPAGAGDMISGRISAPLVAQVLGSAIGGQIFFLCGPPPFMKAMIAMLLGLGIPMKQIRTERFGVGSQEFIERGTPIPKYIFAAWGVVAVLFFGVILRIEQKRRAVAATVPTSSVSAPVSNGSTGLDANINSSVITNTPGSQTAPPTQNYTPPQQNYTPIRPRTMMS